METATTSQTFSVDIPIIRGSRQGLNRSFSLQNADFHIGTHLLSHHSSAMNLVIVVFFMVDVVITTMAKPEIDNNCRENVYLQLPKDKIYECEDGYYHRCLNCNALPVNCRELCSGLCGKQRE